MAFLDFEISVPLFPAEKNLQSLQQDFTSLSEIGDPDVTVLLQILNCGSISKILLSLLRALTRGKSSIP
jgi:hypothetical protein